MLDRLYANSFQNIVFRDLGLPLSDTNLPSASFYAALYQEIERRGGEIPDERRHLTSKRQTAALLMETIRAHYGLIEGLRALSWGAGLGVVEAEMARAGLRVHAVEVEKNDRYWSPLVTHFRNIADVPSNERYDVAFSVSTLYSMTDTDARSLLSELRRRLTPNGLLILFEQDSHSVYGAVKSTIARLIRTPSRHYTLWGFLRTPAQLMALRPSGVRLIQSRYFALRDDWSYREIDDPLRILGRQLNARSSRMQMHAFGVISISK